MFDEKRENLSTLKYNLRVNRGKLAKKLLFIQPIFIPTKTIYDDCKDDDDDDDSS